jgi:hypothetical protein
VSALTATPHYARSCTEKAFIPNLVLVCSMLGYFLLLLLSYMNRYICLNSCIVGINIRATAW